MTIPKGLTFNTLVKLAASPKIGKTLTFRYIWNHISSKIGKISVDKTYRVVITNNVLKNSRNLSASDQEALVKERGCEMPKALEATVLLVVTFMSSGEHLYGINPWTYTRCSEHVAGYQLVVGGSSPAGVSIFNCNLSNDTYGVGGVLAKFY